MIAREDFTYFFMLLWFSRHKQLQLETKRLRRYKGKKLLRMKILMVVLILTLLMGRRNFFHHKWTSTIVQTQLRNRMTPYL